MSKRVKEGYLQVGVELYGGGIWASWFDRDLSLAGRVIVSSAGANGPGYTSKLVKIDRPLLRIPTLAPHLDSSINEAFKFNKETEFKPILGLVSDTLNDTGVKSDTSVPLPGSNTPGGTKSDGDKSEDVAGMKERHHPMMLAVLADELDCSVEDIQDFEL